MRRLLSCATLVLTFVALGSGSASAQAIVITADSIASARALSDANNTVDRLIQGVEIPGGKFALAGLRRAQAEIRKLTPEPKQGRRQYSDEESFKADLEAIIQKHKVAGLLDVSWETQEFTQQRLIGRGRAGADRPSRAIVTRQIRVTSVKFSTNVNAAFTVVSDTQLTTTVPPGAVTGPEKPMPSQ